MRFGVLGAVAAWRPDGTQVAVGGPRSRTLLALLALDAGRFVPAERLIDGMYGEHPPDGAANALQSQVSRLRTALKDLAPVEFTAAGYRLAVAPDEVDVHCFERLTRAGRALLKNGEHGRAAEVLGEALALWRGPAFTDLADAPFAATQATRLEELRADAADDHVEARLALGQAEDVLAGLRETVAAQPLRERPRAQLVRALAAAGRPADALAAFEDARRTLADELGADPGPELAEAHLAVLRGETEKPVLPALPAQLTTFVGRDAELRQVTELLARARLVTLTGPGGTGKTRLAIEVAAAQAGPVAFVELAPHGGADVAGAVLAALGLRESSRGGPQDPVERLVPALRDRPVLLVLDNCEHVVDVAARLAARLLAACPGLRVLATSREPLGITGEQLAPVPRLAVPPPGTAAAQASAFAAIRLFAERAAASDPAFALDESTIGDVQHVCAALDGLPLALELAAARVRTLDLGEIAARLDDRFRLLARGSRTAAARHRSLRGVVEWSWDLLTGEERSLARRFAVFSGGATAAAAAEVCGADVDLLPELADKSLVEAVGGRFRMLETIRAFGGEKLAEAGEAEKFHRAHAEYFLRFAAEADPMLRTAEQLEWLARIDADYDNILAALRWSTENDVALALRLVPSLAMYWWMRGRRFEGAGLSLAVVSRCSPELREEYAEEFLVCVLGALAGQRHESLEQYLPLVRRYATDGSWAPRNPMLVMLLGVVAGPPGDDAERLGHGLLAAGDAWGWALLPMGKGLRAMMSGDLAGAEEGLREGAAQFRALGERWGLSMALDHLSQLLTWRGEYAAALPLMDEALGLMHEIGATDDVADLVCRRAWTHLLSGDHARARADYELAAATARRSGMPESRAAAYVGSANLARLSGDLAAARELCERALAECPGGSFSSETVRATALIALGWLALAEGDRSSAVSLHRSAVLIGRQWNASDVVAFALEGLAGAAQPAPAAVLLGAAAAIRGTEISGPDVTAVRGRLVASLGVDGFERAYRTGLGMSAQKALEHSIEGEVSTSSDT
ncbi:SARP family transcriptional regulator fused with ATPase domain [Amycolatopsis mediterranei S699]|uniref:SARP family transcriptional regulator fused with ATPase domain n=3 Tax=Amycolatopsis mediterranei TaxID=33910 RepID=A0A0H3CTQ6_AMYMU|nr:BTAD domain-containing putative transcriptional regulator [Amycolatopsis mediterranei]ADJ42022.1 SARP family transcriptional regulator fused with ATPase domain [Amycolatopsis mediterranei U32]AEK38697.1 SARP family transcriptional regulator fused with ATPase domain [Amycolatopsis mediterranei S699]AFO73732.1 SARP family transcriptional regulator fused with ATPase domain [Amycolatopsis mediterranei S699]AGT80861.1 SARP family transcriptional regulator fused with ATPase domain [Amycolatopsis m